MMCSLIKQAPVIGFIRYSQRIEFGDKVRDVFEPDYFEYRFNIFREVTLKSFQQQTKQNFVLLVLHSAKMPPEYKERFFKLEEENDFLYNIFTEDTQQSFLEHLVKSKQFATFINDVAITFRIDNDDAVPKDYIERLNDFLDRNFTGYLINIPNMLIVKRIAKELFLLQERYFPANSMGLANVTDSISFKTVLELGDHDLVNNDNSLILLPKTKFGVVQTINGSNAINEIDRKKALVLSKQILNTYLKERQFESINFDCLHIFKEGNLRSKTFLKVRAKVLLRKVADILRIKTN